MRTFNSDSWDDVINRTAKKYELTEAEHEGMKKLPYNMQIIAATKDSVDKEMQHFGKEIQQWENSDQLSSFIQDYILSIPVTDIITTNYSYEIEKTIKPNYSISYANSARKKIKDGSKRQKQFMIYRYNQLQNSPRIWHIHGEACTPSTITMGGYYYGKLLYTIQEYISHRMRYLRASQNEGFEIQNVNWIDLFLTRDVYTLGYGIDLSEIDFWWLVCFKKRNFPDTKIYVYEPNLEKSNEKRLMAEVYGIELMTPDKVVQNGEYSNYLQHVAREIKEKITK